MCHAAVRFICTQCSSDGHGLRERTWSSGATKDVLPNSRSPFPLDAGILPGHDPRRAGDSRPGRPKYRHCPSSSGPQYNTSAPQLCETAACTHTSRYPAVPHHKHPHTYTNTNTQRHAGARAREWLLVRYRPMDTNNSGRFAIERSPRDAAGQSWHVSSVCKIIPHGCHC